MQEAAAAAGVGGGGAEAVPGGAEPPAPEPPPGKAPAFDLLGLVRSYRRLELYLEPLRDAAQAVRCLLR